MGTASAGDLVVIKRALISVSDKAGLVDLGRALAGHGVEILSTGGTARALADAGVPVREVSDHTGFPEMMDGRVKTLHPKVHGGLLALRDNAEHTKAMTDHDIGAIDLVVVNLYPFEETVAKGADFATCIENIDIGGPAMIRSAAKNHAFVAVSTDPGDYADLIAAMAENNGATDGELRQRLAARAYARTGSYDGAIATWFAAQRGEAFPDRLVVAASKQSELRYGENPHQAAAFYTSGDPRPGVATARQLQGKELSYNNLNDTDAAFELIGEFDPTQAAVAIIKHANPCGVAVGTDLLDAYQKALRCDPVSAFGGIIATNRPLDGAAAAAMVEIFTEVIIAPEADEAAIAAIAAKKNLRLLLTGGLPDAGAPGMTLKSLAGGYLLQSRDSGRIGADDIKVVSKRQPSEQELADLLLAFRICKHVKSNAIIYVKDGATVGIGAGQMSRVDSARIAARKSEDAAEAAGLSEPLAKGSVVASDAFFPFADGLLAAAEAGATAVIQPGGSMRDEEVIAAADEAGLAMVLTGMRHFRH
ncbi:MAG: bifunctional phosphoribosylaminoimidazolecarboxamide formyltransferase/IMP cyclohydrolase [Rhodospirillaceae bacterium]|jgi:phosphoribosylaminoimidazolecarboxamide formyltransferase / IMP cyclohydrolase|nr:bifunctional phosphoribosylaminoimidazolecarboxamide formyltransferase/IMP cyclohydrolase [Rhodospirillaceae bacterium]MBT5192926.1 bifunctional phosphoribosylaminoimidazolecarboxamide formyltransferase/IMP cyclohydrolase [Rhodospirillaceae bacterium]MBT5898797.1 bifunctional phosphoribosylaminoimidazolecarboxamide formyltransferase/IMP cyclohydrolase [Rhodospirillaceae bacterium]MBT6427846.1 bifunctional phosphoribosylaminoimidazolecarboxamide formyltransferase/IMP cyclohydrolase [Rhodospiri